MCVKVTQSCLTLCYPIDCIVHGILQARILEWIAFPFSRGSSQPRDRTKVSGIEGRFLTSQPTWKPKNGGVGSLFLLQWIFSTQKSNWQICYQVSYQGSLKVLPFMYLSLRSIKRDYNFLSRGRGLNSFSIQVTVLQYH